MPFPLPAPVCGTQADAAAAQVQPAGGSSPAVDAVLKQLAETLEKAAMPLLVAASVWGPTSCLARPLAALRCMGLHGQSSDQ